MIPAASGTPSVRIMPDHLLRKLAEHPPGSHLYISRIGYYPEVYPATPHMNGGQPYFTFLYILQGQGWCETTAGRQLLKAGQYLLIPPQTAFQTGFNPRQPWELHMVQFAGDMAAGICRQLGPALQPVDVAPFPARISRFTGMLQQLDFFENTTGCHYAAGLLHSYLLSFTAGVFDHMQGAEDNIIARCINFMKVSLHLPLSLPELAAACGISASYLSALFAEKTQYAPVQLFTSLRMQEAARMLLETALTVKDIGLQLGYPDQYTFSRAFKLQIGVSPKTFRDNAF